MRKIHLANEKKRDAEIGFEPGKAKEPVTYVLADGRKHSGARLLKSTLETEPEALAKAHPDLAAAIEQGDPEVDMELVGRKLEGLSKVYLSPDGSVAYGVTLTEKVYAPDGTLTQSRAPKEVAANIAIEGMPIRWTGKSFPKDKALRKFVFVRSYQVCHINGLTYDFLYDMAKKLAETNTLMLVGSGEKGNGPLVLSANGTSYRAFLEGRVDGDKYILILRLSNLELKRLSND